MREAASSRPSAGPCRTAAAACAVRIFAATGDRAARMEGPDALATTTSIVITYNISRRKAFYSTYVMAVINAAS